jgi:hypothetical protein
LLQQRYYGSRALQTLESLRSVTGPILYVSPEANPTVATLQDVLQRLPKGAPRELAETLVARMHPGKPDEMSWMWSNERLALCVVERDGHYVARQVRSCPCARRDTACS